MLRSKQLIAEKLKYLVPMTIIFMVGYIGLTVLAGFAKGLMGIKVIGSVNLGFVLIALNYVLSWVLAIVYGTSLPTRFSIRSPQGPQRKSAGRETDMNITLGIFIGHSSDHSRHHLLGRQAHFDHQPISTPPTASSPPPQNGFALAGDWCSAAAFLGFTGLTALYGMDGAFYALGPAGCVLHRAVPDRRADAQHWKIYARRYHTQPHAEREPPCSRLSPEPWSSISPI